MSRNPPSLIIVFLVFTCVLEKHSPLLADEIKIGKRTFTLASGFTIEQVASHELIKRPISGDFDSLGRLYLTESSGSNENVQIQLKKKPHRVMRLEDTNNDGRYDNSTVFADKLMFPAGAMWLDGSLYVAAPPQILKLTDTTGDGYADKREVWFEGKTLTGCANDLHGPYLGPDGWIYWCKGAFAEQSYSDQESKTWKTRAAHLFRRHPSGGVIETVMTGGMDNPVEIAFTAGGERVFTTTFLQHPRDGKRDGLIHAIYGGVYGKDHGVLDGHPRTGDLMPVLSHQDASAPSGLVCLKSNHFGNDYRDNLLSTSFNMNKVFRHKTHESGGLLKTTDSDFLVCDDLDFHPTDIIEDADGSLLVVDTGGWYKLCCPTSQLVKPDILGTVYRIRRIDRQPVLDPRGKLIDWDSANPSEYLNDRRISVRDVAFDKLIQTRSISVLASSLQAKSTSTRLQTVWALAQIDSPKARALTRIALQNDDETVRQVAAHSTSLWRDSMAIPYLRQLLKQGPPSHRRVAAEALGRIGDSATVDDLLLAAKNAGNDRGVDHSITYALIEIGETQRLVNAISSVDARTRRAALIALDQIPVLRSMSEPNATLHLQADQVIPLLSEKDLLLQSTGWWLIQNHPTWANQLQPYFQKQFQSPVLSPRTANQLALFLDQPEIQAAVAKALTDNRTSRLMKTAILDKIQENKLSTIPENWLPPLASILENPNGTLQANVIEILYSSNKSRAVSRLDNSIGDDAIRAKIERHLRVASLNSAVSTSIRLKAMAIIDQNDWGHKHFDFVLTSLDADTPLINRLLAIELLGKANLTSVQRSQLLNQLDKTGASELEPILQILVAAAKKGSSASECLNLGTSLLKALDKSKIVRSIKPESLEKILFELHPELVKRAETLLVQLKESANSQLIRMESVLKKLPTADVRNGQRIFHGTKASCSACHQMGYLGGDVGPSLSRIGNIRSERDLLESIMYPNASFVRSFEPFNIAMKDGRSFSGILRNETSETLDLVIDAEKTMRISKIEIEDQKPGVNSIMPSGLDQQFSDQELADLIKFIKVAR